MKWQGSTYTLSKMIPKLEVFSDACYYQILSLWNSGSKFFPKREKDHATRFGNQETSITAKKQKHVKLPFTVKIKHCVGRVEDSVSTCQQYTCWTANNCVVT